MCFHLTINIHNAHGHLSTHEFKYNNPNLKLSKLCRETSEFCLLSWLGEKKTNLAKVSWFSEICLAPGDAFEKWQLLGTWQTQGEDLHLEKVGVIFREHWWNIQIKSRYMYLCGSISSFSYCLHLFFIW